jgi:hypothetical protein
VIGFVSKRLDKPHNLSATDLKRPQSKGAGGQRFFCVDLHRCRSFGIAVCLYNAIPLDDTFPGPQFSEGDSKFNDPHEIDWFTH